MEKNWSAFTVYINLLLKTFLFQINVIQILRRVFESDLRFGVMTKFQFNFKKKLWEINLFLISNLCLHSQTHNFVFKNFIF